MAQSIEARRKKRALEAKRDALLETKKKSNERAGSRQDRIKDRSKISYAFIRRSFT